MCEPTTIALGMMAMSGYSAYEQQKAQKRTAEVNIKNAESAQIADQNALKEQADQIASKAQDNRLMRQREAMRERSKARVMANGNTGNSIDRIFNTSYFNQKYDEGTIERNKNNGLMQNYRELEKVNATALGRYRNAQTSWNNAGGVGRLLIAGAQGGLQGYSLGKSYQ